MPQTPNLGSEAGTATGFFPEPKMSFLAACALAKRLVITSYHGFIYGTQQASGQLQVGRHVELYAMPAWRFVLLTSEETSKLQHLTDEGAVKATLFVAEAHDLGETLGPDGFAGLVGPRDWTIRRLDSDLDLPIDSPRILFEHEAVRLDEFGKAITRMDPYARLLVFAEGMSGFTSAGEAVGHDNKPEVRFT